MIRRLSGMIDKIPRGFFVHLILGLITFFVFFDFFTKGFVLDGAYDRRNYGMPYYLVFIRSLQAFQMPQWNPFLFCGSSLFVNSGYAVFYPFNLILWLFPENTLPFMVSAIAAAHFYCAGYFMFLLIKKIVTDEYWALCGASAYLMSSASLMSLTASVIEQFSIFVYTPLLCYLILSAGSRKALPNIIALSTAFAFLTLVGQFQYTIYALSVVTLFAIFTSTLGGKFSVRTLCLTAFSLVLGLMLSAVRNVPFLAGTRTNAALRIGYENFLELYTTPPAALAKLFFPEFYPFMNKGESYNAYAGIAMAFLAGYALLFIWNRHAWFWKVMAVSITLMVLGTPLTYVHYVATGKSSLAVGRMAVFIPFCVAVLGSMAGRALMDDAVQRRRFITYSTALAVLLLLSAAAIYLWYPQQHPTEDAGVTRHAMRGSIWLFVTLSLPFIGLLIYVDRSASERKGICFRLAFLCLLLADLFLVGRIDINSQNPSFSKPPFFQNDAVEQAVADTFEKEGRGYRILGLSNGTSYNRAVSLGLYNSSGFEGAPPSALVDLYSYPYAMDRSSGIYRHIGPHVSPFAARAMRLTSTRYVMSNGMVYEIDKYLPRYSLYYDYVVSKENKDTLALLLEDSSPLDISRSVVVDAPPGIPISGEFGNGAVTMKSDGLNEIQLSVSTPGNAILLLTDTFDSGWKAFVDGRATDVMRGNYAFRAVAIPKGEHEVTFSFTHAGLGAGKAVSGIALAILLSLCAVYGLNSKLKTCTPKRLRQ